ADRRHRGLYGNLLVRGLQWLRAAEDVPHLDRAFAPIRFRREPAIAGSHHQSCSNKRAPSQPSPASGGGQGGGKEWAMVTIRTEMPFDIDARAARRDRVWAPSRFQKTAERLREGREPSAGLSFVAEHDGDIVGTVRLWDICAGPGRPAVVRGPLAGDGSQPPQGIGGGLMRRAMAAARRRKQRAGLLVGDAT